MPPLPSLGFGFYAALTTIRLNPYLNFDGKARVALEFYQSVLGGSLTLTQYDAFPALMSGPSEASKIMHGQLETEDGMTVIAADYPASMAAAAQTSLSGHSVSVSGDAADRLTAIWSALAEGATVQQPFESAPPPWGDVFGSLTDRFGVDWMVMLSGQTE